MFSGEELIVNWREFLNISKHIMYTQIPPGVSFGRNVGLQLASTKYVFFVDDDFVFTKKTNLSKLLNILEETDIRIAGMALSPDSYFNGILRSFKVKQGGELTDVFCCKLVLFCNFLLMFLIFMFFNFRLNNDMC